MRRSLTLAAVLMLTATVALSGCGDDDKATTSSSAGGVTLRIGYQRFGGLSLVKARGKVKSVTWSLFESGPALTEALKAGSIDLGQTGEAPPIFAAAAKTEFVIAYLAAVARGRGRAGHEADGYATFADLKGKKIALNKGSNVNWLLLKLLEKHNLKITDIDVATSSRPRPGPPSTTTRSTPGSSGIRTSPWPSSPASRSWRTPPGWPTTASTCSPPRTPSRASLLRWRRS